tara:strand:+ start:37498 stop:38142 length:645 start_codon:yes stop_codon:yes gene_type:complete
MPKMTLEQAHARVQRDSLFAFVYDDGFAQPVYDLEAPWVEREVHLLPGSFNPIHRAHEAMFEQMRRNGIYAAYEISMERIDKEFLTYEELQARLVQFNGKGPVLVDRWPYFMQKAGILRNWNLTFHVGVDTAIRLVESHGIAGIQGIAADFVVYDRIWENRRQGLGSCMVFANRTPSNFRPGNTPDETLLGLSSTAIRAGHQTPDGRAIASATN